MSNLSWTCLQKHLHPTHTPLLLISSLLPDSLPSSPRCRGIGAAISSSHLVSVTPASSHSSPSPVWGHCHRKQSSINFSNVSFSHGLQFLTKCSIMCPFHRVQSIRNRLLHCGSPTGSHILPTNLQVLLFTGPARSLLQAQLPRGSQPLGIHLLQQGILQVDLCSPTGKRGIADLL